MTLSESDHRLYTICRAVEKMTTCTGDLTKLQLDVELLDSFDDETDANVNNTLRDNPAAFSNRRKQILVNSAHFFTLTNDVQKIVLIHEAGHAYLHILNQPYLKDQKFSDLNEDHIVDLLLCTWGFEELLIAERSESYGKEYCVALRLWRDETNYIKTMGDLRMRRLAGIP